MSTRSPQGPPLTRQAKPLRAASRASRMPKPMAHMPSALLVASHSSITQPAPYQGTQHRLAGRGKEHCIADESAQLS